MIPKFSMTLKEFHLICKETATVPMYTELDLGAAHGHSVHLGILASEVYEAAPLLEHVWCNLDHRHHHHLHNLWLHHLYPHNHRQSWLHNIIFDQFHLVFFSHRSHPTWAGTAIGRGQLPKTTTITVYLQTIPGPKLLDV